MRPCSRTWVAEAKPATPVPRAEASRPFCERRPREAADEPSFPEDLPAAAEEDGHPGEDDRIHS